jgi:ribonucleotide monophosphatase NagD (HAD superfamily)
MATIFVGIDGCLTQYGTNKFLPGAVKHLKDMISKGHQVVFITERPAVGNEGLKEFLQKEIGPTIVLVMSISSPRIIIDSGATATVGHKINDPWDYDFRV